jgi:transposase
MDKTGASGVQRVEVITSVERRRRWAPAEKKAIVEETYEPGMSVSAVARRRGIPPNQIFRWRRLMEDGALTGVGSEERVVAESELKKAQERIKRLERLLGQKTEEVEVLKEAVRIGREKKLISRQPLLGVEDFE